MDNSALLSPPLAVMGIGAHVSVGAVEQMVWAISIREDHSTYLRIHLTATILATEYSGPLPQEVFDGRRYEEDIRMQEKHAKNKVEELIESKEAQAR